MIAGFNRYFDAVVAHRFSCDGDAVIVVSGSAHFNLWLFFRIGRHLQYGFSHSIPVLFSAFRLPTPPVGRFPVEKAASVDYGRSASLCGFASGVDRRASRQDG